MRENFSLGERELAEVLKAVKERKIDFTEDGLMVVRNDFQVGGIFPIRILRDETVQRAIDDNDPEMEAWARNQALTGKGKYFELSSERSPNLLPNAAINSLLNVYFGSGTKTTTWYIGCFTSNWDVATTGPAALSDWAKSGGLATELPNASYTQSNRQIAAFGAASNRKIATSTPATFTLATGVTNVTLYGATLNSIATVAYSGTDQILAAATKFGTAKSGLAAGDKAEIGYEIAGSSA